MEHYSIPSLHNNFNSIVCCIFLSVIVRSCIRMSVGTSDTTVISSTKTEAHNLNTTDTSAAQRDDASPATILTTSPKNRQYVSFSDNYYLFLECTISLLYPQSLLTRNVENQTYQASNSGRQLLVVRLRRRLYQPHPLRCGTFCRRDNREFRGI